ncbi:hypothetical protein DSL72_000089 [Monilinia vaccinii-corymbosi]|uniref:Uncharacterized protein n=1 Tax=Monilinia vaccinii-corymbosi TaxID=61207 RepID=A0A8A3NXY5_9HELO|nr:hypothetical protein DSL72_000089 [Monilinia vaccinii-corymbosi]
MAAFRRIPLELREKIYGLVLELDDDDPLPPCYVETPTGKMGSFERALIPDRDMYRELVRFRIRNSVLRLQAEYDFKSYVFSGLIYSTERMCPLAREAVRVVNVEIPGNPSVGGRWGRWATTQGGYLKYLEFDIDFLVEKVFKGIEDLFNVEEICLDFQECAQQRSRDCFTGEQKTVMRISWDDSGQYFVKSGIGRYLNRYRCLHTFELAGRTDADCISGFCKHSSDAGGEALEEICDECLDGSWIWSYFDDYFDVESSVFASRESFSRVWVAGRGERLKWSYNPKTQVENKDGDEE